MKKFDTFQEFMDWSVQKIVDQGGQCFSEELGCLNSDGQGRHCLIGWNLPESVALKAGEEDVEGLINNFPDDCSHFSHFGVRALSNAQDFHDAESQLARKGMLQILVNKHNLDPSPPQYQQWIDMGI